MKYLYLSISIVLHTVFLLLAFLASPAGEKDEAKQPQQQENRKEIIPKQVEVELVEPPKEKGDILEPKKVPVKASDGLTDCGEGNWYGGIGIYENGLGLVQKVIEGYPAHKAGILAGDSIRPTELRGEPGTPVTVTIYRQSIQTTFTIVIIRDRICTE